SVEGIEPDGGPAPGGRGEVHLLIGSNGLGQGPVGWHLNRRAASRHAYEYRRNDGQSPSCGRFQGRSDDPLQDAEGTWVRGSRGGQRTGSAGGDCSREDRGDAGSGGLE